MMREDVKRARVDKYGSFLFCPERDTICSFRDTEDGSCGRDECLHDDSEWLLLQEKIEENRKKNIPEKKEKVAKVKATTTRARSLAQRIKMQEERAAELYRKNRPNAAEEALIKAVILKGVLKDDNTNQT